MGSSKSAGGSRILVCLAAALGGLALVAGYARVAIVDSDQFANRATAALRDDSVRKLVAQRVTDNLILRREADLLAARPIIESAVSGVVGSRPFTGLFRLGVRDVHRAVFQRDQNTVTLTVADVGTVVSAALERFKPGLARRLGTAGRVELFKRELGELGTLARVPAELTALALILLIAALACAAAGLALARDRRRAATVLGIAVAVAGGVLVVALAVGRSVVTGDVEGADERAAAGAVWDAFLGDLRTAAFILAASGAVVAAAAASLIRPVDVAGPLRRASRWVTDEPRRPALRVVRGVALVAAGVLVQTARDAILALIFTVAGIYLVYAGVTALLRLVYQPPTERERRTAHDRTLSRRVAAVAIAAALVIVAVSVFVGSGGVTAAAPARGGCNGHEELCDRPLDRVALAATHNAMSVPLPGWFSAEQGRPIGDQLRAGVRGLLIDTHYADRLPDGKLRTVFGPDSKVKQATRDGVSPEAVRAALRIRDRLGFSGKGERGMYLCHTFCELGGTPLASVLRDIHTFLVANPGEVVVVINQDYVTPADFVGAVEKAGLGDLAYKGPVDGDWPTLREMIDSNQRVVFLAENRAGAAPWYHPVYDGITEETPYTFNKTRQLTSAAERARSCRDNRGRPGSPLFLVNHWISTDPFPRPSDAAKVNAYEPLLARARECERLRGHPVNLLAVNFYALGDVFRVVDTLNGVR